MEWTGATNDRGYGQISFGGKRFYVHRIAYEEAFGPIPNGLILRHKCDNPACCLPKHLETGVQADNMADMAARNRRVSVIKAGTAHYRAKLTDEDVAAIREARGEITSRELGMKFGVSKTAILRIWRGKTWKRPSGDYIWTSEGAFGP